jgi:hypothetical protein
MLKDEFDFSRLKIYDTSMFPQVNREEFLKENHLYFLNSALEPYEKYIKFTEEYLDNEAERFQEKHLKSIKDENEDWKISEKYVKRMMEIDGEFAQRFRESIIVQLYSFFEIAIVGSCEMYYSNKEIDDESEDTPDKAGLDYAKSFLKNKVGIELRLIHKELDFFIKLKTLRNRLVHHQTIFFTDEEKKINDIRALSKNRFQLTMKLDIIPTYSLFFDKPNFSLEVIQNIKSLYEKLGKNGVYY